MGSPKLERDLRVAEEQRDRLGEFIAANQDLYRELPQLRDAAAEMIRRVDAASERLRQAG